MLRVPLTDLQAGPRRLSAESARYVTRVHRLVVGDAFIAFDPAERLEASACITAVESVVRVELAAPQPASLVAARPLTLIQGLAKGAKVDAVVRDATELGVTTIIVALTERSVRRGGRLDRWQRIALEAARQCGRGDLPEVLQMDLAEAFEQATLARWCLHPRAEKGVAAVLHELPAGAPLTIAVGPEGGFSEAELSLAQARGFELVSLGKFVLRTETACAAVLGAVLGAFEDDALGGV